MSNKEKESTCFNADILMSMLILMLRIILRFIYFSHLLKLLYCTCLHRLMSDRKINPLDIQRFVRNNVDHSFNKQVFNQELNDQIQKNLMRLEENTIKDMKRQMILRNQQQSELEKRQKLKKQLEEKLSRSKQKRQRSKQEKKKQSSIEKKHRIQLFNQRISQLKKKQIEKTEQKLKELSQKQKVGGPIYNKVTSAVSLIEEPHYKRKLQLQQSQYKRLKEIVQQKSAFKNTMGKRKQLSLTELRPRQSRYSLQHNQKINKMGQHLQKIEETRKKKEAIISQKIKLHKLVEKDQTQQRNERIKLLLESQKKKQQSILSKLSKSVITNPSKLSPKNERQKNPEKTLANLNTIPKGSILYEQGQERQKHSYRKQIKQQIKQYMIKQKQKYLFSQ